MAKSESTLESEGKVTGYDQFKIDIPHHTFPAEGMAARAAQAIVNSYAWMDASPMLNLSSFVTTFCEPEALEVGSSFPQRILGAMPLRPGASVSRIQRQSTGFSGDY
jgi:glutamate/tyrosine decarboxylase-like PLP-dependent enzyme